MIDITKRHIFGRATAHVHVIEFQKRGLPHAHILVMLKEEDKYRETEEINSIVVAELPDKNLNPKLYERVSMLMIHGPCGMLNPTSPCMENGICTKGYPKNFVEETQSNVDGYPVYRRRHDKKEVVIRGVTIDNRWVVPHNPYLLLKYNAHINVEVCSSIKSIKYLFKYIYKGHDCASLKMQKSSENNEDSLMVDEVAKHLDTRYVSPPEAVWRLHERYMQKRSHTVERLPVHLPNEQIVYFQAGNEREAVESASSRPTKLTDWFAMNRNDDLFSKTLLYREIPEHYTWNKNKWQRRKKLSYNLGRMYTVNPLDYERFFLRIILLHRRGATSFEDLRTVNGEVYETFLNAAKAMNLVENDDEWRDCLQEAAAFAMPRQLRELFAYICVFCSPSDVKELWEQFKNDLSEDFKRDNTEVISFGLALGEIEEILSAHGTNCLKFHLPPGITQSCKTLIEYSHEENFNKGREFYSKLNNEQKNIVDNVLQIVKSGCAHSWYIDGPGGTGKTFLYKCITYILRSEGKIVLPVAWTGIAATLIEGGRTAHSTFKFSVPLTSMSSSSIRHNSPDAETLRSAALIIWDETSMVPKHALTVLDRLLKDVMQSDELFGGKCILFGGDFRQILPVVRNGNRVKICEESVKFSHIWPQIEQFELSTNMRANEDKVFSEWLLQLGNGTLPIKTKVSSAAIEIPLHCLENSDILSAIFDQRIEEGNADIYYNRAILCPKNEDCLKINEKIVSELIDGENENIL